MAVAVQDPHGQLTDPNPLVAEWRDKIKQAKEDRKRFEPTWLSNLAFAAGKHYLMWDRFQRTLVMPRDLQEAMGRGELYTSDVITERRMRALGEMSADDDRPELLLVDGDGDGVQQDYAEQVNRAVGHGWDHEWDGDEVMLELRRKIIDLGTAAVRCRFDAQAGPVKQDQVPFMDGKPLLDPEQARAHVAEMAQAGATADIRSIHEGRIRWEVLSPFNILVPPGVEHERDFPWEIVVRPVPLERVQSEYGDVAADLKEDTDIGNIMGLTSNSDVDGSRQGGGATESSRLRNHVWVYTCYLRPTSKYPKGRKVVLASNEYRLMEVKDELPYVGPDGDYRSGIAYYHWWRVTGRFFSRSLVEPMKDVQRRINKRTNQIDKTIDRDQPVVFVDKNGNARKRKGFPMEVIALEPTERQPIVSQGHGPGAWMYQDKEDAIADLDRASTIGQSALGENPENAQTYGQLALLHEQEAGKRQVIKKEHQAATATLIEDSVYDIRTYWGSEKQILMDSDDDQVEARVFNATKIPPFFIVRAAKGASKPRTQAAELQKVNDIWTAALASGAVASNPPRWIRWYKESLDAGQALELPEQPNDAAVDKAGLENHMLLQGEPVTVAYYDNPTVHIPLHREAQIEADEAGNAQGAVAIEQHIQEHMAMAAEVAQQQAAAMPVPPPAEQPGGPPAQVSQPAPAGA